MSYTREVRNTLYRSDGAMAENARHARIREPEARARFAASRVVRLATVGVDGGPHVVPVTFACEDDVVVFAIDHKPKRTRELQRIRNIRRGPRVSFLADAYDDAWKNLWWVRADATAQVLTDADPRGVQATAWLVRRYTQYAEHPPEGPVVWADVSRWSWWSM